MIRELSTIPLCIEVHFLISSDYFEDQNMFY